MSFGNAYIRYGPVEVLRAVKVIAADIYGGNLWQLRSDKAS